MGDIPVEPSDLDTIRNEIIAPECAGLVRIMKEKYHDGIINIDDVGGYCYTFSGITTGRVRDLLVWVSDEIYLCGEGVKDLQTSLPEILTAMKEIQEMAPNKTIETDT